MNEYIHTFIECQLDRVLRGASSQRDDFWVFVQMSQWTTVKSAVRQEGCSRARHGKVSPTDRSRMRHDEPPAVCRPPLPIAMTDKTGIHMSASQPMCSSLSLRSILLCRAL